MPAVPYPIRYRKVPRGRVESLALHAEIAVLLDRATELDRQQRALSSRLADVRSQLAALRLHLWPRVDPADIVHGYRVTHRGGPPPIPPVAGNAHPVQGKDLRSTVLAVLACNDRPMTLVEIHRELHLNGYAIASRHPVKRLADCLGYEIVKGRARRVERAVYVLGELNPGARRRITKIPVKRAQAA